MTTIIGVQYEDKSLIVADSQITDDSGRLYKHPDMSKIVRRGDFVIAGAGEVQPCDIVQNIWEPPLVTPKDARNLYQFMIVKVMPSLRQCLLDNGYDPNADSDKSKDSVRFEFLMSVQGEIFSIDEAFSVLRSEDGIYAIGSGAHIALGALHAKAKPLRAMQIAAKLSAFTAPPFTSMEQTKP